MDDTIRVHHHPKGFTPVDNRTLRDEQLSFRARGVLAWLLSQPSGWRINRDDISRHGPEGQSAIRAVLKELTDAGYLVRNTARQSDGTLVTETVLYEVPPTREAVENFVDKATGGGKPTSGKPTTGFPTSLIKTRNKKPYETGKTWKEAPMPPEKVKRDAAKVRDLKKALGQ